MEINRNQYFLAGLVLLFLGLQFRFIDTVELAPKFSEFLAEKTGHQTLAAVSATTRTANPFDKPIARKTYQPPDWLGWSLLSIGSVLILHSWAMQKPGG
jgi:hypothetical protein